ncbi:MAG: VWA domain-containing protein [Planctomycetaceae bacterium]|jgi:hypothetical protein|nr:VWA domain-containing protein [Planctomycetaceae bacterium]
MNDTEKKRGWLSFLFLELVVRPLIWMIIILIAVTSLYAAYQNDAISVPPKIEKAASEIKVIIRDLVVSLITEEEPETVDQSKHSVPYPKEDGIVYTDDGIPWKLVIAAERLILADKPDGVPNENTLQKFDFVYVCGKTSTSDSDSIWVKVSKSMAAGSALGWFVLNEQNAFSWVHRVGFLPLQKIESNPSVLNIYESADDCRKVLDGKNIPPIGTINLPRHDSKRNILNPYPILEQQKLKTNGRSELAYRIAMLGQQRKEPEQAPEKYTNEEIQNIRREILTLDIVVVMDITSSMDKWMKAAKQAVENFAHSFVKDNDKIDVRFKLITYRDIEEIDIHQSETIDDFCRRVSDLYADAGDDEEESGYTALVRAFKETMFRNRSQRILLLVGDAPFHTNGINNPEKHNNNDVIRLAKDNNTAVYILSAGKRLTKQVAPIAEQTDGQAFTFSQVNSLITEATKVLKNQSEIVSDTAEVFDGLIAGKTVEKMSEEIDKSSTEITRIVNILREVKGIDTERLSAGKSVAMTGWIMPFANGYSAGKLETLLFRHEAEAILQKLHAINRMAANPELGKTIFGVGRDSRTQSSEPFGVFFTENKLPFRDSSVLSYSPDDLAKLSELERLKLQDSVCPLINRLVGELSEESRWLHLPNGDIRGWISESCLP